MGLFDSISGKAKVNAAKKKVLKARATEDKAQAEKMLAEAMAIYATVPSNSSAFTDALYNWGMAIFYTARMKSGNAAKELYEEAGTKFSYCLVAKEDYLASAIDWGVALMELAPLQDAADKEATYALAKEKFTIADSIQEGVASYNFACLHAVHNDFDACKESLVLALEYKNLPDEEDILNDADMQIAKTKPWFNDFIASIYAPEESEGDDAEGGDDKKKESSNVYSKSKVITDGYKVEYDKKSGEA
ncbi:MAG: hypothetical protein KAG45_09990 [Methyloprofundus sp.]|nr:hypothetical protein [Methyloprofundus sp.]